MTMLWCLLFLQGDIDVKVPFLEVTDGKAGAGKSASQKRPRATALLAKAKAPKKAKSSNANEVKEKTTQQPSADFTVWNSDDSDFE